MEVYYFSILSTRGLCCIFHPNYTDTEFFKLLPRAKIGNLPASAIFFEISPLFSMIFCVIKEEVYDIMPNEA